MDNSRLPKVEANGSLYRPRLPNINALVRFIYNGGSRPGEIRIVRVKKNIESTSGFYIEGEDLTYNTPQYRKYNIANIADYSELERR